MLARFEDRAMGSPLRVLVSGATPTLAGQIWSSVRGDIETSEASLSRFRPESPLCRLNAQAGGSASLVPPRLRRALAVAERARRVSGGLFEPRVLGALANLGYAGPAPEAPVRSSGWQGPIFELCAGQVRITEPLDLDGIGKGLALRWAVRAARDLLAPGIGLLIEAGGDLMMAGQPPAVQGGLEGWTLGFENPDEAEPERLLATINLPVGALATSSSRLARWTTPAGTSAHHLVDPRTGEPGGAGLLAVSVVHPDPAWAEVWTKVLFFAGPRDIGPRARALGLAAWWVGPDATFSMTPAARMLTGWTA